ncbi:MAG: hypothetical protein AAB729_00065, partial [Patescibacteria group bacterium]
MNRIFKGIFFTSAGIFLLITPSVQAATKYVPTPQQLQPPPANVQPNLSGNINYVDPSGQGVDDQKNSGSAGNQISEP